VGVVGCFGCVAVGWWGWAVWPGGWWLVVGGLVPGGWVVGGRLLWLGGQFVLREATGFGVEYSANLSF